MGCAEDLESRATLSIRTHSYSGIVGDDEEEEVRGWI